MTRYTIIGNPIPQGRPRFYNRGRFTGCYDPEISKNAKHDIRMQLLAQNPIKLDGPLKIVLHFHLKRPKSLPKRITYHIKKPDIDNLIKLLLDALRDICWHDDNQIVELIARKDYGEDLRTEITISEVKESVNV